MTEKFGPVFALYVDNRSVGEHHGALGVCGGPYFRQVKIQAVKNWLPFNPGHYGSLRKGLARKESWNNPEDRIGDLVVLSGAMSSWDVLLNTMI